MGGYGSGRWRFERTRQDTAGLLRVDIRELARMGGLTAGAVATLTWTRGDGAPAGTIHMIMDRERPRLTLRYQTRRDGERDWTPHAIPVWLDTTPCTYGGERTWMLCPGCRARRAVLYSVGSVFACRACHDLAYASTREDAGDRAWRRIRHVGAKLGGDATGRGFLFVPPPKPNGMHWRTYDRLCDQLREAHDRKDDHFAASALKLLARADRLLGRRGIRS